MTVRYEVVAGLTVTFLGVLRAARLDRRVIGAGYVMAARVDQLVRGGR